MFFGDFLCQFAILGTQAGQTLSLEKLSLFTTKCRIHGLFKKNNLDAIHDTVHEMARDEARHGKAFAGLLKRYFGE